MIQFRTGPHMGIPYQEARALGLSSALKGPEFYEQYVSKVQTSTPSERLLMGLDFSGLEDRMHRAYKANRPHVPFKWPNEETRKGAMVAFYGGHVAPAVQEFIAQFMLTGKAISVHTTILKPARKEKPE